MTNAECCGQCGLRNHETKDCKFLGQNKCGICNLFGHDSNDFYSRKAKELKQKREKGEGKGDRKEKKKKKKKKEEMNQGEEVDDSDDEEHIVLRFSHFFTYMPLHHAFLTPPSCLPLLFLIPFSMHFPYAAVAAPTAQHVFSIRLPYVILPLTMTMPRYHLVYKPAL